MISTQDSKRFRVSKPSMMISTQDRLSNLPDSILSHILSFLPTKLAARTSILSKIWKSIWLSLTTLDFTIGITPNHVIHSIILSRDIKLPILSFRLTCDKPEDEDLDSVIKIAIQRRVETLELNMLSYPLEMKFFSNFFTSNTLTVLKLTHIYIVKDLPGISVSSSIKTIYLDDVIFCRTSYVINFFSAFPNLEVLQTKCVGVYDWSNLPAPGAMMECLPNLVRADINDHVLIPLLPFSRALILNLGKVWSHPFVQVPNFYNLTQMELFIDLDQLGKWILKLLQHTPKLDHLIIHHQEIENQKEIYAMNRERIKKMNNQVDPKMVPECLSSRLKTCLFPSWRGKNYELQFAEYIMRNSKVLSTMTIQCSSSLDLNAKYQILQKLSLYPKGCKLIFD
ncbi:F-box/FBD/LRR-repeat protein At3g52680-like [Vicia villosa]|uniref:F-box/FBD/LRR-repeat protein At3g52680-like n=1 Tax=Vicia villosa TaxID=3911 RepID=UPI00273C5C21|nr:F-box/FBD/LRR-repeat protein At3g52680-like [Vicia villosa]XP_058785261.1 F-box/FBD/LRR-repeat protein At3g52680-like [Vicia villosa]XP_058785262.1 F-box/FBD/LRR-repeat protein At3g52680-like [Vicia villosa]XP_058785263.1 F-box/FBD/LRR-repeat protein At3g52680-like [Vicia villosa]XP_058785264.1 F-box/FBD/LRR-repeat protein At3g52680-like [Vicia villosa]XP_058785265.1 F-box/FBD/LRR-repeat protein At3g52680-like [Vicia villosa]XP_058785267.1 F-box/FBD/LRR-repeat protein At3g52680-like [Vicia